MLRLLVDIRFQVLFHSPPGVLFTFPSRYYALSVHTGILPWRVVPPASHEVSRVSWYSGYRPVHARFRVQGFHLLRRCFPTRFFYLIYTWWRSSTPVRFPDPVWALPRSLAATRRISFDYFSTGYLDVSVHRVPSSHSRVWVTVHNHCWVPPFGNLRVKGCLHLSVAYRSLPRPSSASIAKASAVRP